MLEWISDFVGRTGYVGILLLMLAENVFPPIPSELIMPLAGYHAARGTLSMAGVVAAGTAGSLAGAAFWYGVGRWVGAERLKRLALRHGRWLTLAPADVDEADAWFDRHGTKAVLIGRLVPGIRTLISVPAGIAAMPPVAFVAWTLAGTLLWTTLLALAGHVLESEYRTVAGWVGPVGNAVVAGLAVAYVWRVATFRRRAPRE